MDDPAAMSASDSEDPLAWPVLSAAELSIGRRVAGATRADVQRALWEDRTLVKTFGPRGTVMDA